MNLRSTVLFRNVWEGIGWFGLALLLFLSLTPQQPDIPGDHGDKIGHVLAYAMLTYWWSQIILTARRRLWLAVQFVALGLAIECLQGWTGWRTFDYFDMLADIVGVVFGWILAILTPNLLAFVGRFGSGID